MIRQSESIRTKDGCKLAANVYRPDGEASTVVLIAPSAESTQDDYHDFSCYLSGYNIAVITFDFRGVGHSAPDKLRGFKATLKQWAQQDLDAMLRFTKQAFPKQELIFMGHGIGGEMVGLAAASQFINRIILVSCALSCSRLRNWKERVWLGSMKQFMKVVSWVFGYFPGRSLNVLNNLPKGVIYELINWCNNDNGLFDDFSDHNYRKLQVPLLILSFEDDWRTQQAGVKALLMHFEGSVFEWHHVSPQHLHTTYIGHSGFFRPQCRDNLWLMVKDWMEGGKSQEFYPNTLVFDREKRSK
jgi:predicted alpha/beta hydrolase